MSYRTTAVLLVLLAAFGAYMYFFGSGSSATDYSAPTPDPGLQVLSLDQGAIDSIEVKQADSVVQVQKNADGNWELMKPEQFEGDQSRMQSIVLAVAKLTASKLVAAGSDNLADFGLDKPSADVTIGVKDSAPVELFVGSQNPASTGSYVKRAGSDAVYLVDSYSVNQLTGLINDPPKAKPTPTPSPSPPPSPTSAPVPTATP